MVASMNVLPVLDDASVRRSVDTVLREFLAAKASANLLPQFTSLVEILGEFLVGGKRIRPVLCATGWLAGGGRGEVRGLLHVAACLEMFHTFALIHDDVMDASDTRRGRPTVHRVLEERCAGRHRGESAAQFGLNAAVLLGDLALTYSDELLHAAHLDPVAHRAVLTLVAEMRSELMMGQYLDLHATGELTDDVDRTLQVYRYKTAKYTIERPLQIGAAIAGADRDVMRSVTAYSIPLGEAFQLRDDLLGVYGDPVVTGKSRLDDLRSGKSTTLTALALRAADARQAGLLRALIGDSSLDEEQAAAVLRIFEETKAREGVEQMIEDRRLRALRVLEAAPFAPEAVDALRRIAHTTIVRTA